VREGTRRLINRSKWRDDAGTSVKRTLLGLFTATLIGGQLHAQDAKLVIAPGHGKLIQEYVVTEHVKPAVITVPLEIGATVPDGVQLAPVPLGLVTNVPEVRNYEYFVAGGRVMFVEPYTRKILQIVQ
jgi:hypothetical protein